MSTILSKVKLSIKDVLITVTMMLISSIGMVALPSFLAYMIDDGVKVSDRSVIFTMALMMVIVTAVSALSLVLAIKASSRLATKFSAKLREETFKKVQTFSAAELDKFGSASLVTRSTADITNIQMFMTFLFQMGILSPLMIIVGIILATQTGGKVTSILLIAIPLLVAIIAVIVFFVTRLQSRLRKEMDGLNTLFLESLEGVRVIRAFNKQRYEKKRFGEANEKYTKTSISSVRVTGLINPVIEIIFGVTMACVMGLGTYYIQQGKLEVGTLVANSQYIQLILISIVMLLVVIIMFPRAYTCAKRVAEVLNTETSIVDGKKGIKDKKLKSTVEFKNVTFAYPKSDTPIIKDINFTVNPGEFVAIMGRTGSGKSSILKLIPRFYDVTFGEVLVDGINVKDYKTEELRSIIGYVPQKNVLFSGDVASNLNFGNEAGTEEDWKEAARIACADEFIDKKDDTYHSNIAQGGTNLSGGQRQRMAIARAIMKKPEIYLFDDSLSALDMKTDKVLRHNLRESMGDSAVIMVAQRVGSVIDADRIIVIENNEIVGNGTHKELLKDCPLYREIAVLQLGEEAVKREEA